MYNKTKKAKVIGVSGFNTVKDTATKGRSYAVKVLKDKILGTEPDSLVLIVSPQIQEDPLSLIYDTYGHYKSIFTQGNIKLGNLAKIITNQMKYISDIIRKTAYVYDYILIDYTICDLIVELLIYNSINYKQNLIYKGGELVLDGIDMITPYNVFISTLKEDINPFQFSIDVKHHDRMDMIISLGLFAEGGEVADISLPEFTAEGTNAHEVISGNIRTRIKDDIPASIMYGDIYKVFTNDTLYIPTEELYTSTTVAGLSYESVVGKIFDANIKNILR